jgi:hypothetical protein
VSPAGAKRSEKIELDITCQASREKHEAVVPVHAPIIKQQAGANCRSNPSRAGDDALLAQSFTPHQDAALLAEMLSLPNNGRYPTLELAPQQRRQRTLEALTAQLEALSSTNPVLMIFEDVHWIDPTTPPRADAHTGQAEAGLRVIAEAKDLVARNDEHMWESELDRIEGELRRVQGASASDVEACFARAVARSHQQCATSLELRAGTSLARLWRDQGKVQQASE